MPQIPVFAHPPWVSVFIDDATDTSPGYIRIREGDGRPGAAVLAVHDRAIAMVRVFRRTLGRSVWELPRGFADAGESSRAAAARELLEETGITLDPPNLEPLGVVAPNSGILESEVALFFARVPDASFRIHPIDQQEIEGSAWIAVPEVVAMIVDGRINDAFTIAAVARATFMGLI